LLLKNQDIMQLMNFPLKKEQILYLAGAKSPGFYVLLRKTIFDNLCG